MLDKLVIDLETSNSFAEVGGKQNIHRLKISVIGIYSYNRDEFLVFEEKDFYHFEKLLKETGVLIGFSLYNFDIPVLKAHFSHNYFSKIKVIDLLDEVEKQLGHKISLDDLARVNIGEGKTGNGLEAIELYRQGKIEELKNYCLNDVKITKSLYESALKNGYLIVPSSYSLRPIKINIVWPNLNNYLEELEQNHQKTLF